MGNKGCTCLKRGLSAWLAVCLLWTAIPAAVSAEQQPAKTVSWLLDPGHGGTSRGAAGEGHKEKDDVLRLALAVGRILEENGQQVGYTRTDDVTMSLEERVDMQKQGAYTYFVSIHRNAANREATGFEIHTYTQDGPESASYVLAENIRQEMLKTGLAASAETAGESAFWDRGIKQSNFHVLRETTCPSILIEAGFIDTQRDNQIFEKRFDELAACIAGGCLRQAGITVPVVPPTAQEQQVENGLLRSLAIAGLAVLGLLGVACLGFAVLLLVGTGRARRRTQRRMQR